MKGVVGIFLVAFLASVLISSIDAGEKWGDACVHVGDFIKDWHDECGTESLFMACGKDKICHCLDKYTTDDAKQIEARDKTVGSHTYKESADHSHCEKH